MLVLSMKAAPATRGGRGVVAVDSLDGVELVGIGTIRILDVRGGKVRVGFDIRPEVKILRLGLGAFQASAEAGAEHEVPA